MSKQQTPHHKASVEASIIHSSDKRLRVGELLSRLLSSADPTFAFELP